MWISSRSILRIKKEIVVMKMETVKYKVGYSTSGMSCLSQGSAGISHVNKVPLAAGN